MIAGTRKSLLVFVATLTFVAAQSVLVQASNWKKLAPSVSPSARSYPAMAYDPVSKRVVLYGGFTSTGVSNETWTFDGTTWTHVKTAISPTRRAMATMAFDKPSGKLIMFGGIDNRQLLQDTWAWDGATSTWSKVPTKPSPLPAAGPMLFTDPNTGVAMMFGGFNVRRKVPNLNNTWHWSGTAWEKLNPETRAIGRGWGIAVLDPVRNNVVVSGGLGDSIRTDNTWTWDGQSWNEVFPENQVPTLIGSGSVFDTDLNQVIAFGGFDVSLGFDGNSTWSWDGTNWVQLQPRKSPSRREGVGLAYYPDTHRVVLFGGERGNSRHLRGDTWVFIEQ